MTLVKFENGKYGIRYGLVHFEYRDLVSPTHRWSAKSSFFDDCQGEENLVRAIYEELLPKPDHKEKVEIVQTTSWFWRHFIK